MLHTLNPFLIRFWDDFGIRWYGLSYILGFLVCYLLINWLASRQRQSFSSEMIGDFIFYGAIGTLVGGRLGYCLFYSPDLFSKFKSSFPYWGVLAVNEGGMASHGAMIGIFIACILYARKTKLNYLYLLDLVTATGPIGVMMGRIANFINGELVGRPAPPDFPFSVKFPTDIYLWPQYEPNRLVDLIPSVESLGLAKDQWMEWIAKSQSDFSARENILSWLNKIVTEVQSGNLKVQEAIAPILTARHPSQLYAAFSEGLFLFICLFMIWRNPRKPGVIAASFVILYSIVRVSDEYFRMPDAHIGFQALGLTRGQWLSLAMFVIGVILMFVWGRSPSLSIPGWKRTYSISIGRK